MINILDRTRLTHGGLISSGETTVTAKIAQGSDDARELNPPGSTLTTFTRVDLGKAAGSNRMNGWRFTGLNIPTGATITSATVQYSAHSTLSGACQVYITGQKGTASTTFDGSANDLSDRPRTTAKVTWNIPAWTADERSANTTTPELSSVVQEIIDDASYVQNDAITIFTYNDGEETSNRTVRTYENTETTPSDHFAEISVTYTT